MLLMFFPFSTFCNNATKLYFCFQSVQPEGLNFEQFKAWSFRHVAKYGQPKKTRSKELIEKIKKIENFSMKKDKTVIQKVGTIISSKVVNRNDIKCQNNLHDNRKFHKKLIKSKKNSKKNSYNQELVSPNGKYEMLYQKFVQREKTHLYR